jgi:hypothetical protein
MPKIRKVHYLKYREIKVMTCKGEKHYKNINVTSI